MILLPRKLISGDEVIYDKVPFLCLQEHGNLSLSLDISNNKIKPWDTKVQRIIVAIVTAFTIRSTNHWLSLAS